MDLEGWPRYKMSWVEGSPLSESSAEVELPLPSLGSEAQAHWRPLWPGHLWHLLCEQIPALRWFLLWGHWPYCLHEEAPVGLIIWGDWFSHWWFFEKAQSRCAKRGVVRQPQSLTGEPLLSMHEWFPGIDHRHGGLLSHGGRHSYIWSWILFIYDVLLLG